MEELRAIGDPALLFVAVPGFPCLKTFPHPGSAFLALPRAWMLNGDISMEMHLWGSHPAVEQDKDTLDVLVGLACSYCQACQGARAALNLPNHSENIGQREASCLLKCSNPPCASREPPLWSSLPMNPSYSACASSCWVSLPFLLLPAVPARSSAELCRSSE